MWELNQKRQLNQKLQLGPSKLLTAAILSLASLSAVALESDRDQPIYVAADKASINDNTGVTVYTGNVDISQGSMILRGERVELRRDAEGNVDQIVSDGAPAYFEQRPAEDQAITVATGDKLDYLVGKQILQIIGDAKVVQAGDEFTGARINYDMNKALVDAFSDSKSDTRVRMVIQPRSNSDS
jgi:lipopolysaccharide export system protein LptA